VPPKLTISPRRGTRMKFPFPGKEDASGGTPEIRVFFHN